MKPPQDELPAMTGKGVETPKIKAIDSAIDEYEAEKDKRCKISPREIAAKGKLQDLLHKHRDKLPLNGEGFPFYHYEGANYTLEEKLKRTKATADGTAEK